MPRPSVALALFALGALLVAGCGDDASPGDGGGGPDLSAVADGGSDASAPLDLAIADAACALHRFTGFFPNSPSEQRLDCTCGCVLDPFDSTLIAGYWGVPTSPGATFTPMQGVGLGLTLTTPDGGAVAVGALNSLNTIQPFYLDGDFDVKVDFELQGAMPPDGHVLLTVQDQSPTGRYAIERERLPTGEQLYAARLGGLAPVTIATTAASGTLELKRSGPAITALADGAPVSAFTGAGTARVALVLTGALASCNDGGVGCQLAVVWRNARMSSGAIVDRR